MDNEMKKLKYFSNLFLFLSSVVLHLHIYWWNYTKPRCIIILFGYTTDEETCLQISLYILPTSADHAPFLFTQNISYQFYVCKEIFSR